MTNYSTSIFLINDDVTAVKASYDPDDKNEQPKTFKTFNKDIKVDDYLIVPTDSRHEMTVVKVVDVEVEPDFDSHRHVHWVIGVIDRSNYEETIAKENEAIAAIKKAEKRQQRDKLREAMLANHADEIKQLEIAKNVEAIEDK